MNKKEKIDLENMSGKEILQDVLGHYHFKYGVFCIEVGVFTYLTLLIAIVLLMTNHHVSGCFVFLCHVVLLMSGLLCGEKKEKGD